MFLNTKNTFRLRMNPDKSMYNLFTIRNQYNFNAHALILPVYYTSCGRFYMNDKTLGNRLAYIA